jgi:predicted DNA-binding protein
MTAATQKEKIDVISIKMPHQINTVLESIAQEEDRSKSSLIRVIISQYIEDYFDARDAQKALKQFEQDGRQTVSAEEVFAKCGLDWNSK